MTWCLQNFTVAAQAKSIQKKNCSAGFGDYCYIPECKSVGISLFKFPKDNTEKRRWVNIISMYRRKVAGNNFSPYDESKKYFVWEHHFKADEIRVSLRIGRKTLKPGAILVYLTSKNQVKSSLGNRPRKGVYQLQMNPLATILILKRTLKLITQMTYYQSCTLKQILIVQNCWKRRLTT